MKRLDKFIFLLAGILTLTCWARADQAYQDVMVYMEDDREAVSKEGLDAPTYIDELKTRAQTSQEDLKAFLDGCEGVESYKGYYISNLIHLVASEDVVDQVRARDDVKMVEENVKTSMEKGEFTEVNPLQMRSVGLAGWNQDLMNLNKAKDRYKLDGSGVTIAFIDSQVDLGHEEIAGSFRGSKEGFSMEDSYANILGGPVNEKDHGTGVISIALAREDGRVRGVAPGADWILARAFDKGSTGNGVVLDAAQWILAPGGDPDKRPDIVNNSWGGSSANQAWFEDVLQAWLDLDIFPVFASGNSFDEKAGPGSIENPASLDGSFSVGAIDSSYRLADFSKRGPSPYFPSLIKPEIVAPGVEIFSAMSGGSYGRFNGTSASAPHISGLVALLRQQRPDASVPDLKTLLIMSSRPLTDSQYPTSPNMGFGYGLPDAAKAVDLASKMRTSKRLAGSSRFETASKLSQLYYPEGSDTVYLTNGTSYIDALVMASLYSIDKGPLLLANEDDLPPASLRELDRIKPARIVLIGGENTLSLQLEETLRAKYPSQVTRISGQTRYDTALEIARKVEGQKDIDKVYLVNGTKEADAISASGPSNYLTKPVLLIDSDSIPDEVMASLEEMGVKEVSLVGGEATISPAVEARLKEKGYKVDRLGGSNRYQTSILINRASYDQSDKALLANGQVPVDALAAASLAGGEGLALVLVPGDTISQASADYIREVGAREVILLGGEKSVSDSILAEILFN